MNTLALILKFDAHNTALKFFLKTVFKTSNRRGHVSASRVVHPNNKKEVWKVNEKREKEIREFVRWFGKI